MAKRCAHCHHEYPDHESVCPHCHTPARAEGEVKDSDVFAQMWLDEPSAASAGPPPAAPDDSAVHIEAEAGQEPAEADQNLEAWLAEEAPPAEPGPGDIIAIEEAAAPGASDVLEVSPDDLAAEVLDVAPPPAEDVIEVVSEAEAQPAAPLDEAESAALWNEAAEPAAEAEPPLDVIDVAEEAPQPRSAQPTQMAGRAPQPTMLAPQLPAPTKLAPSGFAEGEDEKSGTEPPTPEEVVLGPDDALEVTSPSGVLAEEVVEVPTAEGASDVLEVSGPAEVEDAAEVAEEPAAEEAISAPELVAESGSALDLGEVSAVKGAQPESSSAVNLGGLAAAGSSVPSGLDPIAEALESGVDLAEAVPAAEEAAEEAVELGGEKPTAGESSAVDLGATVPMSDKSEEPVAAEEALEVSAEDALEEAPAEAALAEEEAGEALLAETPSAVEKAAAEDLLAEEEPAEAEAGEALLAEEPAEADEALVAEEPAEAEEAGEAVEVAEEPEVAEEEEEELVGAGAPRGRKEPAHRKAKYGRRWLGGTLLGVLLAAGGAAAVWYFQPKLITDLVALSPANTKLPPIRKKGPSATPVQEALADMHEGKLMDALNLLESDKSKSSDVLSARGEIRWLKYLHDNKGAPQANAPEVKKALADLQAANSEPARLLLGQIQAQLAQGQASGKVAAQEEALRKLLIQAKAAPPDLKIENVPSAVQNVLTSWQLAEERLFKIGKALQAAKVVNDPAEANAAAVEKLLTELGQTRKTAGDLSALVGAKQPSEAIKKVQELVAARKDLDAKLSEVNAKLKEANVKDAGAKGVADLVAARDKLQTDVKGLNGALVKALTELNGSAPKAGGDMAKELMNSINTVRDRARTPLVTALNQVVSSVGGLSAGAGNWMQKTLDRANLEAQLRYYQAREPLIQSPQQKLDTWIRLYQDRQQKGGPDAQQALRDAGWITSKEAGASPESQAKAHYLEGLIARNEGKFDQARKELQAAVTASQTLKKNAGWSAQAARDLKELTDPTAYYLPRSEQLQNEGQLKSALAMLDTGLTVIPGDTRMLALRSLVRLDLSSSPAQLKAAEKQIRADAEAAKKAPQTAAVAWYALGRLEEELGHLSQAEQDFRQALKLNKGGPAETNRYRLALARVLQRELTPDAEPASPPAGDAAAGEEEEAANGPAVQFSPLSELVALAVLGQTPGDDEDNPQVAGRLKESLDLASELVKSEDPKTRGQGYMLLGVAHSRMGQRTEGLKEYLKGLALVHSGLSTKELLKLVADHPAFQTPDLSVRPSAVQAELHFGRGLAHYWAGQYAKAEEELKKAVAFYGQDARYRYFLGLSRLAQNTRKKREAAWYDFEQGARLEAEDRPGSVAVNSSLGRIQGSLRQYLDRFREKGQVAPR
jgi:hypothetical protein